MEERNPRGGSIVLIPFFLLLALGSFLFWASSFGLGFNSSATNKLQNPLIFAAYQLTFWLGPAISIFGFVGALALDGLRLLSDKVLLGVLLLTISLIVAQFSLTIFLTV